MAEPLISLIIPTYNRADYIAVAIESALSQVYDSYEIVVADDGSTDNTAEVVGDYLDNPLITYYRNTKNLGAAGNLINAVENLSTGTWLVFLYDDDFFEDDKYLARVADYVSSHPYCDIVKTKCVNRDDVFIAESEWYEGVEELLTDEIDGKELFRRCPWFLEGATIYRRESFLNCNYLTHPTSLGYHVDYDLVMMDGKVGYVPDARYVYLAQSQNINKFKGDIGNFFEALSSIVEPIRFARKNNIYSEDILKDIYLRKCRYFISVASLATGGLESIIETFCKYIIDNAERDNIFSVIKDFAQVFSSRYQKDIDARRTQLEGISKQNRNRIDKLENAETAVIYGTGVMAGELSGRLKTDYDIDILYYIDDNRDEDFNSLKVVKPESLTEHDKPDVFMLATARPDYILKMHKSLINNDIKPEKIVAFLI